MHLAVTKNPAHWLHKVVNLIGHYTPQDGNYTAHAFDAVDTSVYCANLQLNHGNDAVLSHTIRKGSWISAAFKLYDELSCGL